MTTALDAINSLTPSMLEALQRMPSHSVTAQEIGSNGATMVGMERRGLVAADCEGLPIIYRLTDLGIAARDALNATPEPVSSEQPVERIQRMVAETFCIPVTEMVSDRRSQKVARPRQVAMYLARETTPLSLPNIGRRFGGRDHTTVMHACSKVESLIETDADLRTKVEDILAVIQGAPRIKFVMSREMTDGERVRDAQRGSARLLQALLKMAA